jgi:hypothetical protein
LGVSVNPAPLLELSSFILRVVLVEVIVREFHFRAETMVSFLCLVMVFGVGILVFLVRAERGAIEM